MPRPYSSANRQAAVEAKSLTDSIAGDIIVSAAQQQEGDPWLRRKSVAEEESSERPFQKAVEVVRNGRFDEVKDALEALGFRFVETTDPNHWIYFHPQLREDPHFRYPRNLYRPHGPRRSSDRISRHDQSQAKQMIEALRGVIGSSEKDGEDDQ